MYMIYVSSIYLLSNHYLTVLLLLNSLMIYSNSLRFFNKIYQYYTMVVIIYFLLIRSNDLSDHLISLPYIYIYIFILQWSN